MKTSKGMNNARARTQVQSYVRGLLGARPLSSAWGSKQSLPKGSSAGITGGTAGSLPRQLEATAYTKSSKKPTAGGGNGIGNAWLLSPFASTVKSILGLLGGGGSNAQSTTFRSTSRQTFRIVEGISQEKGSGARRLNESAAALTGVVSRSLAGGEMPMSSPTLEKNGATHPIRGGMSQFEDRQELVTALRRGLSESRGISDVLNEYQDGL